MTVAPRWILIAMILINAGVKAFAGAARSTPCIQWTYQCGSAIYSSPVAVDLDGDAVDEILITSGSSRELICLDASGRPLWIYAKFDLRLTSTPTICATIGSNHKSILVATRSNGVVCLSQRGELLWNASVAGGIPWGNVSVSPPVNTGNPLLFWVSQLGAVECRTPDGEQRWSYPTEGNAYRGALAVGDLDKNGSAEVVTGDGKGSVFCIDHDGKLRWRFNGSAPFNSGPVIAGLNGGASAVVLAASDDGVLYCLGGSDGQPIWNHRTYPGRIDTSIAAGDVDNDGHPEVFYGDASGNFFCLNADGTERWSFKTGDWIESAPAIGDVDGDGNVEIVVTSADGNVYCLSSKGKTVWTFFTGARISASATLCDVDADKITDILIAAHNGTLYCLTSGGAWDASAMVWPTKRGNFFQDAYLPRKKPTQ
jgi:outer membrane protein assembly factor BamB